MDIQRGRDYGLQGYNEYRKLCGLAPFKSFADIGAAFGNEVSSKYKLISRMEANTPDDSRFAGLLTS